MKKHTRNVSTGRIPPLLLACGLGLASLGLAGCGGGSGSSSTAMLVGTDYPVESGQSVLSTGPTAATLEIRHELASGLRTVRLLEGSAELFH